MKAAAEASVTGKSFTALPRWKRVELKGATQSRDRFHLKALGQRCQSG